MTTPKTSKISNPTVDSWYDLLFICGDGIAKWDYLNCRWCWHMAPSGYEVGDPVPHEWDFGNRILKRNPKKV